MDNLWRVAAVQMNAGLNKRANLARAEALVAEAAAGGAQLVVLPELFNLYGDLQQAAAEAESAEGTTLQRLGAWARQHRVWLAGSFASRESSADPRVHNLAVLIDPAGQERARYAKLHLFDIDLPGQVTSRESDHFAAGEEVVCAATDWGPAGLAICYDLRFPELFRGLVERGAELLIVPSAFTRATGADHWELLVRARAVENQAFVIAANQVGEHAAQSVSYGHSLIVDPWGRVLARADGEREAVVHATLDRGLLNEIRARLPALQHRRIR